MSDELIEQIKRARDAYLIIKRDLYYMPGSCGYTGIKDLAGRYTLDEVAARLPNLDSPNQNGLSFVHEDDAPEFTSSCFHDLKADHLQKQRDEAREEITSLRAELAAAREQVAGAYLAAADRIIGQPIITNADDTMTGAQACDLIDLIAGVVLALTPPAAAAALEARIQRERAEVVAIIDEEIAVAKEAGPIGFASVLVLKEIKQKIDESRKAGGE